MAQVETPVVQQLEAQMERIREHLEHRERSGGGWFGLLGGLGLGALLGWAAAFFLRSREEEPPYLSPPSPPAPTRRDDAIVLGAVPTPASPPAAAEDEDEPIVLKTPAPAAAPAETAGAEESSATEASGWVAPADAGDAAPIADAEAEAVAPAEVPATPEEAAIGVAEGAPEPGKYAGSVVPSGGQCPPSHPIKGNLSRNNELIYHVPGGNNYERTRPESCFASESEAEAAGFRRARS